MPVAPLEAMSTGLPVIVSGLECFLDFLVDRETGLRFDHRSGNPGSALAEKLDEALGDWSRSLELGRSAREAAQNATRQDTAEPCVPSLPDR